MINSFQMPKVLLLSYAFELRSTTKISMLGFLIILYNLKRFFLHNLFFVDPSKHMSEMKLI